MNIKEAYEKQAEVAETTNVRNEYTQKQSQDADFWAIRFSALAAFLGWNHEIITDDCEDGYDEILDILQAGSPNRHEFNMLIHAYEIMGCVVDNGRAPFGQI